MVNEEDKCYISLLTLTMVTHSSSDDCSLETIRLKLYPRKFQTKLKLLL